MPISSYLTPTILILKILKDPERILQESCAFTSECFSEINPNQDGVSCEKGFNDCFTMLKNKE